MEFAQITYTKTVEGNFEVKLINKNTVVATITFPTETLAAEYVDIKTKMKAHADALIAEVTANLTKVESATKSAVATVETKAKELISDVAKVKADIEADVTAAESKTSTFIENMKAKAEKVAGIDTSAKVGKDGVINTSASTPKSTTIDTSAKIVTS